MLTFSSKFTSARGNEYFCEIDEEYLTDRFNLTGLNSEVQYYTYALDLIIDVFDLDCDDDMREQIEKSARHLYGLVHARYINSTRGLAKMVSPLLLLSSLTPPRPPPYLQSISAPANDLKPTGREIQKSRVWKMPSCRLQRPAAPSHRYVRRFRRAIR